MAEKTEEIVPDGAAAGSDGRPLLDPKGSYFPDDSHETDKDASKFLTKTSRDSEKRLEKPFLLLEDLKDLGMYGELSEDQNYITMPFKDVHGLVTTMRMSEIILNERIQNKRKAKLDLLRAQLDAVIVMTCLHCWFSLKEQKLRSLKNTPSSRLECLATIRQSI